MDRINHMPNASTSKIKNHHSTIINPIEKFRALYPGCS